MKMAEVPVHASANQESGNSGFESVSNANTQTPPTLTRDAFLQNEPKIM